LGILKQPHLAEAEPFPSQNVISATMVWLADGKKKAQERRSRDQLAAPHQNIYF
jgi:hypothetical protein